VLPFLAARAEIRLARGFERAQKLLADTTLPPNQARFEARNLMAQLLKREEGALQSFAVFTQSDAQELAAALGAIKAQAAALTGWIDRLAAKRGLRAGAQPPASRASAPDLRIPRRIGEFGPLTFQNDDVLLDRLGRDRVRKIRLLNADSSRLLNVQDRGALYAYEIVNFVDGKKSVAAIRDAVAAEFGPIPTALVSDYLDACEEAKIIGFR
jgi:hypothetical protein